MSMCNFITVQDVALITALSVKTVYKYVELGKMPFYRVNRNIRFDPEEVDKWVREGKLMG